VKDRRILPADFSDLEILVALEKESFQRPWSRESLTHELKDHHQRIFLKALSGGEVVGYAGLWIIVDEGHITRVAVHPQHRGKGIGKDLVQELIRKGLQEGCKGFTLEVRENNLEARRLYASLGFTQEGRRQGYYEEEGEDGIIMWMIPGDMKKKRESKKEFCGSCGEEK
jgi:ribosomal-protein-alanine N-acetyltransferase